MKTLTHPCPPLPSFNIIRAQHYGMCFGVRDAFAAAKKAALSAPTTVLGELVHNGVVRQQLEELGTETGHLDNTEAATKSVLITAHGASNKDKQRWIQQGHTITDTTCPLVHKAHSALENLVHEGRIPVVIGKKNHAEVNGLTRDYDEAIIISSLEELQQLKTGERYGIVSQTTQPSSKVDSILCHLDTQLPFINYKFVDTICRPTKNRQRALDELINTCDFILVVGGVNSNNTKQLVNKALAHGIPSHRIERPEEIEASWLRNKRNIGVTAGTSTLLESVDAAVLALTKLGGKELEASKKTA